MAPARFDYETYFSMWSQSMPWPGLNEVKLNVGDSLSFEHFTYFRASLGQRIQRLALPP
jgi:hypothetical protein